MAKIEREDIQIISRHSNWSEKKIEIALKKDVYNDKASWLKFIKILFISLGISFTTAGVLFFFAYNWADLHKFVKISLIQSLIIITTLLVTFSKINLNIKNIILTGTSILVGILFAVFGQIYQTGANAYDFFLGWTMAITVWVIISNFAPLWLLFITLINTTVILYAEQVAQDWSDVFLLLLLFILNVVFLLFTLFCKKNIKGIESPIWFTNLIALVAVTFSTIGICNGIFEKQQTVFTLLIIITSIIYTVGIKHGLKVKSGFYLSIIPFSVIIIISSFLIELSNEASMFFIISLFVISSITLVIKTLINLQKKWRK